MKVTYYILIDAKDGNTGFSFTDEADLVNFIWDIEDHVFNMAIGYEEGANDES